MHPLRFRANLYVEGWPAWHEFDLLDRTLAIGDVRLKVVKRIVRCAAVNVDPDTAERDLAIPQALQRRLGHADCGIYAEVIAGGTSASAMRSRRKSRSCCKSTSRTYPRHCDTAKVVIPREGGVTSTLRPIDFITDVSGILDRPPSRTMTVCVVIASAAKQSILLFCGTMDCFAALAMTVDTVSCSRDTNCVRALLKFLSLKTKGAGNAGACSPAVSCAMCTRKCAHEHTGTAGALRHSLRKGTHWGKKSN